MACDIEQTNHCIKLFSDSQKAFMRSERRAALKSVLFDLPRRSSLGWHCFYRQAVPLLKTLYARVTPEQIGRRMKRLCSRPNYLSLSILMCSYLGARQQQLLDRGLTPGQPWPEDNIEEARLVVDFWRRASRAYRNDGVLMPVENHDRQPVLDEGAMGIIADQLVEVDSGPQARLRRLAATLDIYAFILHGEQRDGCFAHGPYWTGANEVIIVREFTDLQNNYLPWARTETRNRYPNLALALQLRDVRTRFDLFGGVLIEPPDYSQSVIAGALLTRREDGRIEDVSFDEIPEIERRAAEAQNELYLKATQWSSRFRIEYGVHLFANHLKGFFDIAGIDAGEHIKTEFATAGEELIDRLMSDKSPPSIWSHMATTEGDFFWPLAAEK